ncbi:MAG: hypothetical protein PHY52_01510 [Candidatus Pacebacteria bacterium]|nr:hypothetical protein [Candidatus Paceibacterota bacterium]
MEDEIQKEPIEQKSEGSTKTDDNKLFGILSYIGILCLIPLLTKKDNTFVFFHAKQGLVLFVAEVITSFVMMIPVLGWVLGPIIWIFLFVLSIIGIINALGGKTKEIPVLGKYASEIKI